MKRIIFSGLLLFLVGFIILNQGLFTHTHQLVDGSLITHAHPYKQNPVEKHTPFPPHEHSTAQYLLIANFELVRNFILLLFVFLFIHQVKHVFTKSYTPLLQKVDYLKLSPGRSPPLP